MWWIHDGDLFNVGINLTSISIIWMNQKLISTGALLVMSIFIIDFFESYFANTRLVQQIHNFPDILGKSYPQNPTFITHIEAGLSATKCLIVPLIIGTLLYGLFGSTDKLQLCTIFIILGYGTILAYLLYLGLFNIKVTDPFKIHILMYVVGLICGLIIISPAPIVQRINALWNKTFYNWH